MKLYTSNEIANMALLEYFSIFEAQLKDLKEQSNDLNTRITYNKVLRIHEENKAQWEKQYQRQQQENETESKGQDNNPTEQAGDSV